MGFSEIFLGRSKSEAPKGRSGGSSKSDISGVERALKFAKTTPPKYEHKKKQAIENALISLERAVLAIDATQTLLEETLSLFQTAMENPSDLDEAKRSVLAAQIGQLHTKLTSYVSSATVNSLNLVDGHGSHLVVALSEATTGQLVIRRINLTPAGLGFIEGEHFHRVSEVKKTMQKLQRALEYVTDQNDTFCANATILAEHYERI